MLQLLSISPGRQPGDAASSGVAYWYRRFWGTLRLHLQGSNWYSSTNLHGVISQNTVKFGPHRSQNYLSVLSILIHWLLQKSSGI